MKNHKKAEKKVEKLTEILNKYTYQYYVLDDSKVTDYEFDMLMQELKDLEEQFPDLVKPTSPTKRVGGAAVLEKFDKVDHIVPMTSLNNVFSLEQVYAFLNHCKEKLTFSEFSVEPKIDGLSVSIEYTNGIFTRGSTRGNGLVGENVTANLRTIRSIPLKIENAPKFLEVRGEVYMPRKNFFDLVEQQKLMGKQLFKNPRNAAAGSLRQKDSNITAQRHLDIFVFNVQQCLGHEFKTHTESLDYLRSLGFKTIPYKKATEIEEIVSEIKNIDNLRKDYGFDIDGTVIKINNLSQREIIGTTKKSPKWAVAYKYPPEEKETILLNIEVNVGRTGAITPIAIFDPILLAGTSVSRAILHNQNFIDEKDIRIGDTIVIRKAGEIIPEILRSIKHSDDSQTFKLPENCPSCGIKLIYEYKEGVLRCQNPKCPAQLLKNLIHFASRDAMNINGLGPAIMSVLLEKKMVSSPADLYLLDKTKLATIERLGEKSAENIIKSIKNSKTVSLDRLIYALGIRNIGHHYATLLCEKFKNIDKLLAARTEDIALIDNIGNIIAENVVTTLHDPYTHELIERFRELGLNMTYYTKKSISMMTILDEKKLLIKKNFI